MGVLAIAFDWVKQSELVVKSVRLDDAMKNTTRCVIVNAEGVVIAASDGIGVLTESLGALSGVRKSLEGEKGFTVEHSGRLLVAYAHTPGYETYRGLGWGCVLLHQLDSD